MPRSPAELAAEFLRIGKSHRFIADATGLELSRVDRIAEALGKTAEPCQQPWRCGKPQTGAGRPPRGSIRISQTGDEHPVWCCSWPCAHNYVRSQMLVAAP